MVLAIFAALSASLAASLGPAANPKIVMDVENRGQIVIELFPAKAPKTVEHILKLVQEKFFDGILFHRVVPGFVAQAGDPASKKVDRAKALADADGQGGTKGLGDGGSGKTIPFERNDLRHDKGTLGMALEGPQTDTGDSQFFINLVDNYRLDGKYCVFGKVVKGMDIVLKIERADKISSVRVLSATPKGIDY